MGECVQSDYQECKRGDYRSVSTDVVLDDAEEELKRMEEFRKAQAEIEKKNDAKAVSQKMFKVV